MIEALLILGSALWLGLLTSISPCPLATNIAAVAFLTKEVARPSRVVGIGVAYTVGRALTYTLLAIALIAALASTPAISHGLQTWGNRLLGPLLIVVGMVLLDLLPIPSFGISKLGGDPAGWREKYKGIGGGAMLGVLFALSFCPVSAAIFFGSLIPLAVKGESSVLVPFLFGVGTAVPVAAVALLLATGVRQTGKLLDRLSDVERWARRITGVLFVGIGVYCCLIYLWGIGG